MKLQSSLSQKITLGYLGYYLVAALIVGLSLFTYIELRVIDSKIRSGERVAELFDATLEIRRFEKNYFLYGQQSDYRESLRYVAKARDLLADKGAAFAALASPAELAALRASLERYAGLMGEYGRLGAEGASRASRLESAIRTVGKGVLNSAEGMARTERRLIQSALDRFRVTLLFAIAFLSILMTGLGWALSRMVVRPLRHMESCVEAVSAGKLDKLPIPSGDREVVSITTAFNHMLGELELRQKRLLRSEKLASLGTMLSGVAHELNNPLSNISSSCQILMEELEGSDVDTQKMFLGQIDEQTERARNIVRSLLDFARDRESRREPVPLGALVGETLRFLRGQVPPGVAVNLEIPEGIVVSGDRQRLQQAFLNLLKNALEAVGPSGRISIKASARSLDGEGAASGPAGNYRFMGKCYVGRDVVDVEIHDTGPGIPEEILPRIFDPFFTTKDVGQGMGLGLFIVHEVLEEHDGCISVDTGPGGGTTFFVRLPLQDGTAPDERLSTTGKRGKT